VRRRKRASLLVPAGLCEKNRMTGAATYSTVEVMAGRIVPQGYFELIHRDSWLVDFTFILRMFGFAFFFIMMRLAVARWIVKPLGKPLALKASNYTKLEEAVMQVSFYTWAWTYNAMYLLKQDWFWYPLLCFLDGFPRQVVEPEISFFYSLQIGWYLHGLYTHFFLDTKKSDFVLMVVHHTVTLSLLYGAFAVGYFRIGMLVMFSMDVCDTFLYTAKILKIIKSGGKIDYPTAVYYIGFGMIPISWFFLRLVYFPFVVMRTTSIDVLVAAGWEGVDGWTFFNLLLVILLGLNIWWFSVIATIMWSSVTSKNLNALDDIREKSPTEMEARPQVSEEKEARRVPKKAQ
jgi:hypothetical protein